MELVSPLDAGHKDTKKRPKGVQKTRIVGNEGELTVSAEAHVRLSENTTLTSAATFYCKDNCADPIHQSGFIPQSERRHRCSLTVCFGDFRSAAFLSGTSPLVWTSMDIIVSNFNGMGVQEGLHIEIESAHSDGLFKELSEQSAQGQKWKRSVEVGY